MLVDNAQWVSWVHSISLSSSSSSFVTSKILALAQQQCGRNKPNVRRIPQQWYVDRPWGLSDLLRPYRVLLMSLVGAKILNWWNSVWFCWIGLSLWYAYQEGMDKPFTPNQFSSSKPLVCLWWCDDDWPQVFIDIGGFDGDYFATTKTLTRVGGCGCWATADAIAYHRHHGTPIPLKQQVLYKRNTLYSVIKNYSDENLGCVLPAVLPATVSGVIGQAYARASWIKKITR